MIRNAAPFRTLLLLATLGLLVSGGLLIAGPLDPPVGPVAPTYKTMAEVEPRIAINAANTPGDATSTFSISQPGSYYLTGNVTGQSGKVGIRVDAVGVTVDLCGFSLIGVPGSFSGIAAGNSGGVTIRNGTVRAWGSLGISGGTLIEAVNVLNSGNVGISTGNNAIIRACTVSHSALAGIDVQDGCVIENCASSENGAEGIVVSGNGTVRACTASWNIGIGCKVGNGGVVSGCSAYSNGGGDFDVGSGVRIESCAATFNSQFGFFAREGAAVSQCEAYLNSGTGVTAANECIIESCSINDNVLDGILIPLRCEVRNNHCYGNGRSTGDGAGIHATGGGNRIEGNNCSSADRGIDIDASLNFISRNICEGNATNWTVVAGNFCLVVQAAASGAINGNTGGVAPGSADPNANFTY